MKLDKGPRGPGPAVTGFSGAGFKVDGQVTPGGVLLSPEWWQPWESVLSISALEPLLAVAPEFLLLGTGAVLSRQPRELITAIEERGIGVELMDSRAAARAWAVLRAEDRWIAAALMPLG